MEPITLQSLESVDQQRAQFELELETLANRIQLEFSQIAENAQTFTSLYDEVLESCLDNVERVAELMKQFMVRCEALETHLDVVEVLSKQINVMRRLCEEIEMKVNKVVK